MIKTRLRAFASPRDFFSRFFSLFKGPFFLVTFIKTPHRFREKILLTVSMANNCHG